MHQEVYMGGEVGQEEQLVTYDPPAGHIVDADGRLLRDPRGMVDPENLAEDDMGAYLSQWQIATESSSKDWSWSSRVVWPEVAKVVKLRRLDFFEQSLPRLQVCTTDRDESQRLRACGMYFPVYTLFVSDFESPMTTELSIESTGPPRRSRFRPSKKQNTRDTSKWLEIERLSVFHGVAGVPGAVECHVDYQDFPDRYYLSFDEYPAMGTRRTFHFGAYVATQYFILEKIFEHECLGIEGGKGLSCRIEVGPILYARKDYRLIGSFFGFNAPLPGSSKYTVYQRLDPFPRMMMTMSVIQRSEEWPESFSFYAFDIPVPNSVRYSLHHCIRSIYSNGASVPRHRLTTEDPRAPWEFRMHIYVQPAAIQDCTIYPYPSQIEYLYQNEGT